MLCDISIFYSTFIKIFNISGNYKINLRLKIARIDPVTPATNLTHLTWHIFLGGLTPG